MAVFINFLIFFVCIGLVATPFENHNHSDPVEISAETHKHTKQNTTSRKYFPLFSSDNKWPEPFRSLSKKLAAFQKVTVGGLADFGKNIGDALVSVTEQVSELLTEDGFEVICQKAGKIGNILVVKKNGKDYKLHLKVHGNSLWLFLEVIY